MRHIVEAALAHYRIPCNKVGFDKTWSLCQYRTKDGNHCAIGCLFGEAQVQKMKEIMVDSRIITGPSRAGGVPFDLWACGSSIRMISSSFEYERIWNEIKTYLKVETPIGLALMQEIHDEVASTVEDPEEARQQLVLELEQVLSGNITSIRTYVRGEDMKRRKQDLHNLL